MNGGDALTQARLSDMLRLVDEDLDVLSYYNLLGIPLEADEVTLRQAYHARALMLHPDRYLQVPDDALRGRVGAVYKRIAEAYRVLSNPTTRADYDRLLSRGEVRYSAEAAEALRNDGGAAVSKASRPAAQSTSPQSPHFDSRFAPQPAPQPGSQGRPPSSSPPPAVSVGGERIQSRQAQELHSLAKDFSRRMEFGKAVPLLEQALSVEPRSQKIREALDEARRLQKMYGR